MALSRRAILRAAGAVPAAMALTGAAWLSDAGQGNGFLSWLARLFGLGKEEGPSAAEDPQTLLPYDADPLTGNARRSVGRMVGVMVNNIANTQRQNARPQRGLSAADLLIESKVEGGITRFCAVYHDVDAIPEVGPLRSGRDQFLQLLMPWQAVYYHDGESEACTKFISVYDYSGLNIGGKSYYGTPVHLHVAHRDSRGGVVAYEHTEFTSGVEIRSACEAAGIDLNEGPEDTFFRFTDYRTGEENLLSGCEEAGSVELRHSEGYQTAFGYDAAAKCYRMRMFSRIAGAFEDAVDETNGKQLCFENLLVCFAPIAAYPGDSGDVQQVSYAQGGEAFFFTRGRVQAVIWQKPAPEQPLSVCGADGQQIRFNRGKTYLAITDEDERENFWYR